MIQAVQGASQQHGALALDQVTGRRFAGLLLIGEDPEQVVSQLECPAQDQPEASERRQRVIAGSAGGRAELHRTLHGVARGLLLQHLRRDLFGADGVVRADLVLRPQVEHLTAVHLRAHPMPVRAGPPPAFGIQPGATSQLVRPDEQLVAE